MTMRIEGKDGTGQRKTFGNITLQLQPRDPIPPGFRYLDYAGVVPLIVDALREEEPGCPPLCVCLSGPPGVGKTSAVWAAVQAMQSECFTTQGSTDCTAQDLVVYPVPTDANRFDPVASGICTACIEGKIALLDEIGKVAQYACEALTPLASLLDERRVLWSDFLKMPFPAAPGFGFICTSQINEPLPDYITQRMLKFTIPPPPKDVLLDILRVKAPQAPDILLAAFRDWASSKSGLTPRDGGLIVHFARRRSRVLGGRALSAREADRLINEAAGAVLTAEASQR